MQFYFDAAISVCITVARTALLRACERVATHGCCRRFLIEPCTDMQLEVVQMLHNKQLA